MEDLCSPLSCAYLYQDHEGIEDLRHYVLYTTELETTILSAKEEITRREFEILRLNDLLNKIIKERNEAQAQCQKLLMLNKLALQQELLQKKQEHPHQQQQQQQQQREEMQLLKQETAPVLSGSYSSEDETKAGDTNNNISSSDSNKFTEQIPQQQQPLESSLPEVILKLAADKPLPEKGKLLQAVKEAGPLLQTLLLAGPLPQWQHPPPQLDSIEIPPVTISSPTARVLTHQDSFNSSFSGCLNKKRDLEYFYESTHDSSTPNNNKYQKTVLHC